ncbi:rhomboid family intramembrane serine protease [Anaerosporobacter sp.]|uniref:rhomboid family intramembrane serine protease n=1 Tax=Anaerosporobacter sp. TaxID=1872529 RepID=UPI00286F2D5F|nr:rhomboid family intramembrane serine protease [Anaerosporobacter sp.]
MVRSLIREFENSDYERIDNNNYNSGIFCKLKDDGVYVVSLLRCADSEEVCEEMEENYSNEISQLKWYFINKGYRNIRLLHIVVAEDVSLARRYIKDYDTYWIVNESTNQLVIFENQQAEFLEVKQSIERILAIRDGSYDQGSKLSRIAKNLSGMSDRAITCGIILINVIIFIIMDWSVDWSTYNMFVEQGGVSYEMTIMKHQYYRALTSMFIHADINHLFGNMMVLYFIGTQVEKRLGRVRYTILYFIGGLVATITSLGYNRVQETITTLSIGASGAIFAVVGAMVVIVIFNKMDFEEIGIRRLLFFVAITIINGLNTQQVDNAAHIGGLVAGLLLGQVLYESSKRKKRRVK